MNWKASASLHLSDIHLSAFLSERELMRVIDAANETRAHLALVTGDMITARGDPLDACLRQLARLRADAGVVGCMGNHERYAGALEYAAREGARLGLRFLRGQARQLRFGGAVLNLAGVDYEPVSRTRTYLAGAERLIVPGACNVLLSHNPDVFPVAARKGFDLTVDRATRTAGRSPWRFWTRRSTRPVSSRPSSTASTGTGRRPLT